MKVVSSRDSRESVVRNDQSSDGGLVEVRCRSGKGETGRGFELGAYEEEGNGAIGRLTIAPQVRKRCSLKRYMVVAAPIILSPRCCRKKGRFSESRGTEVEMNDC